MLLVCVILGILAGMMMLMFGGATEKTRATKIAAELESVKQAALTYESRHKTRNNNPLENFTGSAKKGDFTSAINGILENPLPADRVASLLISGTDNRLRVAFEDLPADANLVAALDRFVQQREGSGYSGNKNGGAYSLYLLLK
jgi:type II secretory pathway pseudopilin PulG